MGVLVPKPELSWCYLPPSGSRWSQARRGLRAEERGFGYFPCAVNSQLRTGADKGNPTV